MLVCLLMKLSGKLRTGSPLDSEFNGAFAKGKWNYSLVTIQMVSKLITRLTAYFYGAWNIAKFKKIFLFDIN